MTEKSQHKKKHRFGVSFFTGINPVKSSSKLDPARVYCAKILIQFLQTLYNYTEYKPYYTVESRIIGRVPNKPLNFILDDYHGKQEEVA